MALPFGLFLETTEDMLSIIKMPEYKAFLDKAQNGINSEKSRIQHSHCLPAHHRKWSDLR